MATITSKGQITIPKKIRDALGIGPGDRVSFVVRSDGVAELRPENVDLLDLYGVLEHDGEPISIEKMNEDIGEAVAEDGEDSYGR